MAVSTATYNWYYSKTLVTAEGTLAEVCTELTAGASSQGTLEQRPDLITIYGGAGASGCTAIWWTPKKANDTATGDWTNID